MNSILLLGILILLLIYLVASSFILYHLLKFGVGSETKLLALVFVIGLVALFILLATTYNKLDISNISIF